MNPSATAFTVTAAMVALPTFGEARMQKCVDAFPLLSSPRPVEADKRLTDPAKIAADIAKKEAKRTTDMIEYNVLASASGKKLWLDTATSPLLGGWIFAIAIAIGDGEIEIFDVATYGSVAAMMEAFWSRLAHVTVDEFRGIQTQGILPSVYRPVIVGHGVDVMTRFIAQTCVALRIKMPCWWPVGASQFAIDKVFDVEGQFVGPRGKVSLEALCAHLGIPVAQPFDVVGYYQPDHANPAIVSFAADTVRRVRALHHVLVGMEPLESDVVELGGEPMPPVDDEEADEPTIVPADRFDPDEAGAMDGEPIDETDLDQDVEPNIDDRENV